MARDFCERFSVSRDVFGEASDELGLDVAALCFEDDPRLDLTEFTQPAILTAEIAMWRAVHDEFGLREPVRRP
jgi:malonyl CoA-acyl carrier protein transacylase